MVTRGGGDGETWRFILCVARLWRSNISDAESIYLVFPTYCHMYVIINIFDNICSWGKFSSCLCIDAKYLFGNNDGGIIKTSSLIR
ncbi:hypothetical protein NIES4101_48660 [Calothrix sp. NIES-4101]|nr:hypothetical protein NIES4101_48660 [Calothrix sp. NIES-4101]